MRNLSKTFVSIVLDLSGLCLPLSADEAQEDQRLEKAIEVISNPETPGERKHEAMVTLQELKDARAHKWGRCSRIYIVLINGGGLWISISPLTPISRKSPSLSRRRSGRNH